MPRRKYKKEKKNVEDPKYGDRVVGMTINAILRRGKKSVAERIVYGAFDEIEKKTGKDPTQVFSQAIRNIKPTVMVKSRRVGGATYQVPIEVDSERGLAIAIRWLVSFSKERKGMSMERRLCEELIEASEGRGGAVKKRQDTHKMADANRAFSHYRF
ncbi:MAG: 30S ribosomal protein S7 [bacterium]